MCCRTACTNAVNHSHSTTFHTTQHTDTAACERALHDASLQRGAHWGTPLLTLSVWCERFAAGSILSASLHTTEQQQRVSARCMSHAMRRHSVHVAAWHSPRGMHSSMRGERQSERAAQPAAQLAEISMHSGAPQSSSTPTPTTRSATQCSMLITIVLFLSMADHCWWRTRRSNSA